MTDASPITTPPPEPHPGTLAIRGKPPRAIRVKRGVVIALAGSSALAIAATGWMAVSHGVVRLAPSETEVQPAVGPGDALASLPRSYGDVPKLGPPLPGDLGKPILEHERQMSLTGPAGAMGAGTDPGPAAQREAEISNAHRSPLLVRTAARDPGASDTAQDHAPDVGSLPPSPPVTRSEAGAGDAQFDEHRIVSPASPYLLSAGSVIPASLITGVRSDLPGIVTAQVTERVFDSATGRILLIPQGARLIGRYDAATAFGQTRLRLAWHRLVYPDGSALALDPVEAGDPSGNAGLEDKVDSHGWVLLKGVALATLLGVGTEVQFGGQGGLTQAIRQSGQQSATQAGDKLTSRALDVRPTITIRAGAPVRLVVQQDLVLRPWEDIR